MPAEEPVHITLAVDDDAADDAHDEPDTAEGSDEQTIELRFSATEVLRHKDFADYSGPGADRGPAADDPPATRRLAPRVAPARRQQAAHGPTRPASHRAGGDEVRAVSRSAATGANRRTRNRRLVLLLDVSGSMEPYARALLRFVHAAVAGRQKVEAFALGTRLTRITRELSSRDPDIALRQTSTRVVDWSGGTRLGDGLRQFNDAWGQRGMARGAIVVILSDGWDRGDPAVLAEQMVRLHRVAHKVIWVNPLKVTPGYAPLARGMAAALPYVDAFVEGHSVAALEELARAISEPDDLAGQREPWIEIPFRHGTLDTPIRRAASVRRSHVAVVDGDTRLTYGELDRRIAGARAGLARARPRLAATGSAAWRSTRSVTSRRAWAIPTSNLMLNDLNFRLALPELEFIVNDSGARVLLADARHWETAVALLDQLRLPRAVGVVGRRARA